jgi:hypothetical protein
MRQDIKDANRGWKAMATPFREASCWAKKATFTVLVAVMTARYTIVGKIDGQFRTNFKAFKMTMASTY